MNKAISNRLRTSVIPLMALTFIAIFFGISDIRVQSFTDMAFQPTAIKGEHFPKILVDATGEEYLLPKAPSRIVSLTLGTDEILSELVEDNRLAGVTYLADDPAISNIPNQYPEHTKRVQGDIEEIIALQPDLVFIASYTRAETVHQLLGANIPVVRLSAHNSFADLEKNILLVSQATGSEKRAEALVNKLRRTVKIIKTQVQDQARPRVLFYNLNGYTSGPGTISDEMLDIAGGYNLARKLGINGTNRINEEMAIGLQPDIILMTGQTNESPATPALQLMQNPIWKEVPAVANGRVYDLNSVWLLSVSHYSWNGITQIAELLYPGVFSQ